MAYVGDWQIQTIFIQRNQYLARIFVCLWSCLRARYIHAICEGLFQVFKEIKEAALSEHLAKKLRKYELDLKFLVTCRYFAVYPKFARWKIVSKILTRSRWRLKRLRSELKICSRENQDEVKEPFVKLLQQESFFVMLHHGENFREFDPRPSLTETVIEMFFGKSCTLYDTQIITLNIALWRSFQARNIQAVHQRNFVHKS